MEHNFVIFAEETLNRKITGSEIIFAKRNPTSRNDADIVEINNLLSIWNDLPLRGKRFFVIEAERLNIEKQSRYLNQTIPSYNEYVDYINNRNRELLDDCNNGDEYEEPIISENIYNSLSFDEYAELLNFKKPRKISPYILFTKTYRAYINNEDELFSPEQRSFSSMGEKLGSMWACLPDKGKLDY